MPKRASRKTLKKQCDTLFSLIVRHRGTCEACSARDGLQCAHIVSRRYMATRWREDNAMSLCARCHMYYTYRPIEWSNFVDRKLGVDEHAQLRRDALAVCKPNYFDLRAELKNRLYNLTGEPVEK